jgi:serine/threonine protein kinase
LFRFKVVSQIAEGGFGFVFHVRGVDRNYKHQQYALKKLLCQSSEQEESARKEIEVLRAIKHPNVISLLSSSRTTTKKGLTEILLLFTLYNGSVQAVIDAGSGYPSCGFSDGLEVVHIIRQAIDGLCAVHAAGYRHAGTSTRYHQNCICANVFFLQKCVCYRNIYVCINTCSISVSMDPLIS